MVGISRSSQVVPPSTFVNSPAIESINKSDDEGLSSHLGASAIRRADLNQLILLVFDEEYDPKSIKRRVQQRQSRRNFNFRSENLEIQTDCPVRVFQILEAFVDSERVQRYSNPSTPELLKGIKEKNFSGMKNVAKADHFGGPSDESKALILDAIRSVEYMFIGYAHGTVSRVIDDLKE